MIKVGSSYAFIPDNDTPELERALLTKFAPPTNEPAWWANDKIVPGYLKRPFGLEISEARNDKASTVRNARDATVLLAMMGMGWAGSVLLLSWLIRGFMG